MKFFKTASKFLLGISMLTSATTVDAGNIYKWTDENGQIHYSQTKPANYNETEIEYGQQATTNVSSGPHRDDCDTIVCRANKLEKQRLELERRNREQEKKNRPEKSFNQLMKERSDQFKKEQDEKLMADCKKRREIYCEKGVDEIRRQDESKATKQKWQRLQESLHPYVPRNTSRDIHID